MKTVIHRFYLFLIIGLFIFLSLAAVAQTAQPIQTPEDLPNPPQVSGKYLKQNNYITCKPIKTRIAQSNIYRKGTVLIQAFLAAESNDAVPVDQIIIYPNQKIPVLMLSSGSFPIRAMNRSGKVTRQYEKKIG